MFHISWYVEVKDVRPTPLSDQELFIKDETDRDIVNTEALKQHFFEEGRLSEDQVMRLLELGTALLRKEPNLVESMAPITIVGDIHGQYYDLIKIFEVAGGEPPVNKFLFLGDYVHRGYFSFEVYSIL